MYDWRRMNPTERRSVLQSRISRGQSLHQPPKFEKSAGYFLITAACFEHRAILDLVAGRRINFSGQLLAHLNTFVDRIDAWVVLPNHYHALVITHEIQNMRKHLGQLHGKTSHSWNCEDGTRGRKVWFQSFERRIRSRGHYYSALNYIHHNPVKHGYCRKWTDWDTSSARAFIDEVGRENAVELWHQYPIRNFGVSMKDVI